MKSVCGLAIALVVAVSISAVADVPTPLSRVVDYEPSISPDGKRIAFVSNRDGRFKLYVMARDGTAIVRLTDDAGADDAPAWSPDGRRIAFVSEANGNADVFIVDADGRNRRRLTNQPGPDLHPTWSPDGKQLLFNALRRVDAPDHIDVYQLNADGGGERRLTDTVSGSFASWSPDGRTILLRAMFGDNSDIALMSADGRIVKRLTSDPAFDGWPSWSPDGRAVVFARERGDADETADIYVLHVATGHEQLIVGGPGRKTTPRWTSDGHIIYGRRHERQIRLWQVAAPENK